MPLLGFGAINSKKLEGACPNGMHHTTDADAAAQGHISRLLPAVSARASRSGARTRDSARRTRRIRGGGSTARARQTRGRL